MKNEKGITLIALIITIIVMLILVGVSVTVALDGGLFKTAQDAAEKTQIAIQQESGLKYNYEIAKATGEFIGSYDEYVLQEKYGVEIGAKVNYEEGTVPTSGMEWRVLGVNNKGEIELISTKPTEETVELEGKEDYLDVVTMLDIVCGAYGEGEGASGARALTVEDINKLAGYDPTTDFDEFDEYGTKFTYKYANGSIYGILSESITDANKDNITGWTDLLCTELYTPEWTITSSNIGPEELENTYYYYTVASELTETTPDNISWAEIITEGEGGTSVGIGLQCLASYALDCSEDYVDLIVYVVDVTDVCGMSFPNNADLVVRPVVSLKADIKLTDSNNDGVFEIQ